MSERITREEAERMLEKCAAYAGVWPKVYDLTCAESYALWQRILATIDAQRWVPVTERLPEHGQRVLVSSPGGEPRIVGYGSLAKGFPPEVTHWMPLPTAPEVE